MKTPKIKFPKSWTATTRSAILHVIALAQYATVYTRSWAANSLNARVRLKAENDRLRQEVRLLEEEIRIKDARMERINPHKRSHYGPTERLAILELRAARGWSQQQTADTFGVTAATIASWMERLDEAGPAALVQLRQPVNRFPEFVRYAVQRLKVLCPSLGKVKIAQILARAGLHLSASTVGRILSEEPVRPALTGEQESESKPITARAPNEIWQIDITTVPIDGGFWTPWLPQALPQYGPFCWWVAIVLDQASRRVMGFAVFPDKPTAVAIRALLGRTIHESDVQPRSIICDKGVQFWCDGFKAWCRRRKIRPRYGAVGKHGSIAVMETFVRTLKREGTRRSLVPMRIASFRNDLKLFIGWYNEHRPNTALNGCTPNEIYDGRCRANRRPRIEPRAGWPRRSPCAQPKTLVAGQPGARFDLAIRFVDGRRNLPVVTLNRAA